MEVVTKPQFCKANEIKIGECFRLRGASEYIYMRISPIGVALTHNADMAIVCLNTGDIAGWVGREHEVYPAKVQAVEV